MSDEPDAIAVINAFIQKLGYLMLKKEQEDVIVGFLSGRDVFAVLPTGFGKTLRYACLHLVFDGIHLLRDGQSSIVLIITPLTGIMKDQVKPASIEYYLCINI